MPGVSKQGREEIARRFMRLCELVGYGEIRINVVDGLGKEIIYVNQSFRLDLTDPSTDSILKSNKEPTTHEGETASSSSS